MLFRNHILILVRILFLFPEAKLQKNLMMPWHILDAHISLDRSTRLAKCGLGIHYGAMIDGIPKTKAKAGSIMIGEKKGKRIIAG